MITTSLCDVHSEFTHKFIQLDIMPHISLQRNESSVIVKGSGHVLIFGKGKRRRESWPSVTFFTSNDTSRTRGSKPDPRDDNSVHVCLRSGSVCR
jgi:hypothetical protein